MDKTLPILTDEEMRQGVAQDEEAGFGALTTARGQLPLKAMEVNARIDGLLSEVSVCQTFVNALDEPLEATYIFPLPDRAGVTRFRLQVGTRLIEGVLKERAEARRDYDQAIQAGHRAAITEEERPGVFTMRVGNIMPGEEATVRLTLVGPLPYSDGEVTFRFPLVVAPRYIPGTPLPGVSVGAGVEPDTDAVPDASRITPPVLLPGFPNPVCLALAVEVQPSTLPLGAFRSSLHAVLEENREAVRRIALKPGERLDRDFILRFQLGEEAIKTSLTCKPDEGDPQQGTFLLTLVPPVSLAKTQRPRDVVFVLDRSGSMGGWKMVAARRALARMVDTLTDQDCFTVYAFDNSIETPPELGKQGLVPATNHNRFRAVEFLARIEARGGTEMAQPLDRASKELAKRNSERDRILVLVTDGQVGNEDQILRTLGERVKNMRIFTLGIDQAVNDAFLKRLAALGGGSCELVESEDRLDEVMDRIHRRIGTAVLTGLRLEPAGLRFEPDSLVPARSPDLFAGAPLCIMGRYQGAPVGALALQAADASGRPWSEKVKASTGGNSAVACVWARGRIRELEDRYVLGQRDLEKQIVDTSLRFGVLCRFTAFVAVDRSEVVNAGGQVQQIIQPVEAPEGWAMLGKPGASQAVACYMAPSAGGGEECDRVDSMLQMFMDEELTSTVGGGPALASPPPLTHGLARLGRGSLSKILGGLKRGGSGTPSVPPVDLTAYRLRAAALLTDLRKAVPADLQKRLGELQTLAGKLATLITDLHSIGASSADFDALSKLLELLQAFLSRKPLTEPEVLQVWEYCEQGLEGFAGIAPAGQAANPKRREGFWK